MRLRIEMPFLFDILFVTAQVFPPVFSDLPAPALELFDLDESFSSERAQVTQLAHKCLASAEESRSALNIKELEYFVLECGRILNVAAATAATSSADAAKSQQQRSAKDILYEMGVRIAKYKKLDRE